MKKKRMIDLNRLATKRAFAQSEGISDPSVQGRVLRGTVDTVKIHGGELILLPEGYKIIKP